MNMDPDRRFVLASDESIDCDFQEISRYYLINPWSEYLMY